jgi:Tetratricopeptide repeat
VQEELISAMFAKANRLWFREGRTAAALAAYEHAVRDSPADPVLAFQFARALWSVDRFDRARVLLDQASVQRRKLSPTGQRVLDHYSAWVEDPPERYFRELPPALLDRDQLEKGQRPVDDWRTIADAAAARRMWGLAVYAIARWGGAPITADDAKEIDHIETNRDIEENMLVQMYAGHVMEGIVATDTTAPLDSSSHTQSEAPVPSAPSIAARAASAPAEVAPGEGLPWLPLNLDLRVTPIDSRIDEPATLIASLRNPTAATQVVNRRMLVNNPGDPGEIWVDVSGPDDYRNMVGYRVRAGDAGNELFVPLAPGETIEQSWTLTDYASLHLPGEYVVTATYHNEGARAPDGRPMAVGKARGTVRLHRHS